MSNGSEKGGGQIRKLTAEKLSDLMSFVQTRPKYSDTLQELQTIFLERAAVIGSFVPSELVSNVAESFHPEEIRRAIDRILDRSVAVIEGDFRRWILDPAIRTSAIRRLGSRARDVLNTVSAKATGDSLSATFFVRTIE